MRDVCAVVNAHREGNIIIPTLRSIHLAQQHARDAGLDCGVCVLLDMPDDNTRDIVEDWRGDDWQVVISDVDDLGLARNDAVARAEESRFIAFLDGDDLCSRNWLTDACVHASAYADGPAIWHPAANFVFGTGETYIYRHRDMDDPAFSLPYLVLDNYWTALSFGERSIYREYPYMTTRLKGGWGYEDWSWNALTVGSGVKHKVVPETAHFIRRRRSSLLRETKAAQAIPNLSPLRDLFYASDG